MSQNVVNKVNGIVYNLGYSFQEFHDYIRNVVARGQTCDDGVQCVGKFAEIDGVTFRSRGHCYTITLDAKFKDQTDDKYVTVWTSCDH